MIRMLVNSAARGELPVAPPRPQGRERNVVITMWDWANPKVYLHDEIATDKRDPTVNANGPIYGALEASADYMPVVDPTRNSASQVQLQVRDPKTPSEADTPPAQPSPYWGTEAIWTSRANAHSFAMDRQGRVWIAARIRPNQTAAFCQPGSTHPSAIACPLKQSGRQMQLYDPKTKQVTTVDTCFGTHHLNFDANGTLWFTGGGPVEGWFNTKVYEETKDEAKAQGWTAFVLDTNGNGKRDAYVEPNQPIDPTKDKRIDAPFYGVAPSPVDGSIWGSVLGMPGSLVRLVPGSNPPATALSEIYEVPWNSPKASAQGFAPRGMDVDGNGVVWTVLSSGQLASFDRRRCKGPLNGPTATGQHCPEGWSLYALPGPNYTGAKDSASADSAYYNFVDRFDMLGVGKSVPLANGNESEALLVLVDGKFVVWTVLSSGQLASFDRRRCKGPLNGPTATGQHCPEGWSLYALPGPNYTGAKDSASADSAYYNFVDRFDMLGVGKSVPLANGNESEALLVLVDGKFLTFRVPYPMGFYAKGMDGRIDDPNAGWKGKAIWTTYATRAPFHEEGGKGTTSKLVKFQVRPDPLAK
ncbi:MAG: hypothetical protein DMF94_09245 [Acidobacteria bacterium]|nr:MAG: hypothetical protein DMF94_09245 [Acidobacteriota bacterium]